MELRSWHSGCSTAYTRSGKGENRKTMLKSGPQQISRKLLISQELTNKEREKPDK